MQGILYNLKQALRILVLYDVLSPPISRSRSQTWETAYPVSIRLTRLWLKIREHCNSECERWSEILVLQVTKIVYSTPWPKWSPRSNVRASTVCAQKTGNTVALSSTKLHQNALRIWRGSELIKTFVSPRKVGQNARTYTFSAFLKLSLSLKFSFLLFWRTFPANFMDSRMG